MGVPRRRSASGQLAILVDSHERYPWSFRAQQATTVRRALEAGDYGVELAGVLVASVERKTLADLVSTLTGGRLRYLMALTLTTAPLKTWPATSVPAPGASTSVVRAWAVANGFAVSDRGRLPAEVRQAYGAAHPDEAVPRMGR